ncbi:MAG: extensin family protein [Sandaracinaceae bacterium]|nr:extensin family protein [Sandaracinaceae bacterium]
MSSLSARAVVVSFAALCVVLPLTWGRAALVAHAEDGPTTTRTSPMSQLVAAWNALRAGDYELDARDRALSSSDSVRCSQADLVVYRGTHIRYQAAVQVHRAFVPRLARFEERLVELATATYGRAPRRLLHRGAYVCRTVRDHSSRLSEHALGNAFDFSGLEFSPLPRRVAVPAGLPRASRRAFRVDVRNNWVARRQSDQIHSRFLHALADELALGHEIFRGIVGPPTHRHSDHLHLDMGPWAFAWYAYEGAQSSAGAAVVD